MEALAELALAIIGFILEVTIHALVFVYRLVMAMFSPNYREKLKRQWNTPTSNRIGLVLGVSLYSVVLFLALYFWTSVLRSSQPSANGQDHERLEVTIKVSKEDLTKIKNSKPIRELVDKARDLAKRKLDQRGQTEKDPAEQPRPAESPK